MCYVGVDLCINLCVDLCVDLCVLRGDGFVCGFVCGCVCGCVYVTWGWICVWRLDASQASNAPVPSIFKTVM